MVNNFYDNMDSHFKFTHIFKSPMINFNKEQKDKDV
jgi:truncated hemoglobin YjbI